MASRIARTPVVQLQRQLSAQAVPALKRSNQPEGLETSVLPSGLTVASLASPVPGLATLGVLVKAGAKYETHETQGVGHVLRIAAGLATKNHTSFAVVRNLQQAGAGLNCSQGREYMLYSTQSARDNIDNAVDFFMEAVAYPSFKPWEINDSKGRMALEIANLSIQERATELLHKAAYRNGLGNSLYAPAHKLGKYKPEVLRSFFDKHFTATRSILVGVGIDHKHLCKYGDLVKFNQGAAAEVPGKYFGGELREEAGGRQTILNIAAETAGMANAKEAVACRLLQKILGTGPKVPYGIGANLLNKAVNAQVGADANVAVSAINYGYADSGLLGAIIISEPGVAGKALESVVAALRSVNVTEADLKAAKKALTSEVADESFNSLQSAEQIAITGLLRNGSPLSEKDKLDMIAAATLADVQGAAKKLSSSKLTLSAVGNLSTVPYLDTL